MLWDFSSAPALRRRSSVLALSSLDVNENGTESQKKIGHDYPSSASIVDPPPVRSQYPVSSPTPLTRTPAQSASALSAPSTKNIKETKRSYDGVYRTNEPLPGKPLIEFEEKVWDLEDEFYEANEKIYRR